MMFGIMFGIGAGIGLAIGLVIGGWFMSMTFRKASKTIASENKERWDRQLDILASNAAVFERMAEAAERMAAEGAK
jgi:hypothetical protein